MKNKLMKLRGKITVIMMNMITCFLMAQNYVYAGGIGSSKLFTGTKSMFNDMKAPLIGLSSVIGIVMIIYNLIRMKMSDDIDTKMYKKKNRYNPCLYGSGCFSCCTSTNNFILL